ncbi:hypothetical protein [Amycolatopsis rifamycinica]|uniref:Uncharacterized protein n=1 Tax=Amycolatopsis rifamycinica TaxID=287986 RepID=A0A066TZK3_9PSEU|nr:hypothetical protein [Amycolatopsis rifamycinica]KDN17289.1 hypothetical protein DV20_37290 [Amycolatopsis rifamycinica]
MNRRPAGGSPQSPKSLSFATFSAGTVAAGLLAAVGRGEVDAVVHDVLPATLALRALEAGAVSGRLVPA